MEENCKTVFMVYEFVVNKTLFLCDNTLWVQYDSLTKNSVYARLKHIQSTVIHGYASDVPPSEQLKKTKS